MEEIRRSEVPKGSLTTWPLGQASFMIKSPAGVVVALDPYLTNACKAGGERLGMNFDRLTPPPLLPQDLAGIDLYLLTHSHGDHLDPETLSGYREAGGEGPYIGPPETAEMLVELGVPENQVTMTWPNRKHTIGDLNVQATFAIPNSGNDLTHVGYLLSVDGGPTFYYTGDTGYEDILGISAAPHNPDVLLTVINGTFRNMGPVEAALLTKQLDPEVVIPYHHNLFPDTQVPVHVFRTNLCHFDLQNKLRTPKIGQPFTFPEA